MIIAKLESGEFVNDKGDKLPTKKHYQDELNAVEALEKPSDKELIELGKQFHPYYQKDNAIANVSAMISEIEKFEKKPKEKVK